jgi:hypothetical protein
MKYNIHVKKSIEETESNKEKLMEYSSSSSSNDERGLIDAARQRRTLMRKVRKQSVTSAMGIPIDDRFGLSVAAYILKNLLRALEVYVGCIARLLILHGTYKFVALDRPN